MDLRLFYRLSCMSIEKILRLDFQDLEPQNFSMAHGVIYGSQTQLVKEVTDSYWGCRTLKLGRLPMDYRNFYSLSYSFMEKGTEIGSLVLANYRTLIWSIKNLMNCRLVLQKCQKFSLHEVDFMKFSIWFINVMTSKVIFLFLCKFTILSFLVTLYGY